MFKTYAALLFLLTATTFISYAKIRPKQLSPNVQLPLIMKLPNNKWYLAVNEAPSHYIFKRHPIIDAEGRQIIPAIMIYDEDATGYKQDVSMFWAQKMQPLTDKGVNADKVLIWQNKDYPLSIKNAVFVSGSYTDAGVDHIIYMIYIIDKHNKGIQVYMDMTEEIAVKYGQEFWDTIHSLKEVQ